MDADLLALRIKVTGGKAGAGEVKALNSEVARSGAVAEASGKKTATSSRAISQSLKRQSAAMKSVGRGMSTYLTLPLVALGVVGVKTAVEFDKSMAQVGIATKLTGEGLDEMRALAIEMGAKTIFSANQSAEAMLELAKSGIGPAQIKAGALATTMNLAATEGLALGRTAEIIGAAMNTFGIKASNSSMIADALAGAALSSSASVEGLAQSLAQGGQSAAQYGLTVNETAGTLAAFAQNGISASDAGTSFKTFVARLNPVTKKAREETEKWNLSFFNSSGQMKGLTAVAAELRKHLGGLSDEQRGQALYTIFGSDAQRAANIVFKEGADGLSKYIKATKERGAAERMAQAQMKGLPGAIERLKGSFETMALEVGRALTPVIIVLAGALEGLANGFTTLDPSMQTALVAFGAVVAISGPVIYALGAMTAAYVRLGLAGSGVAGKLGKRGAIAGLGGVAAMTAGGAIGGKGGEAVSNIGGLAAAGAMFGPWGAAAGAAIGVLITFRAQVKDTVEFVRRHALLVGLALFPIMGGLPLMIAAFYKWHDAIIATVKDAVEWIRNAFRNTVAFFRTLPGRIMSGIHSLPRLMGRMVVKIIILWATLPVRIPMFVARMSAKVIGLAIKLGPKLASLAVKAMGLFARGFANGAVAVYAFFRSLPDKLASLATALGSKLASAGADFAREFVRGFKDALPGPLKDAVGAVGGAASSAADFAGGLIPGNAMGTPYWRGGLSLVGERGPEIVNVPRGAQIIPSDRTSRLLSGAEREVRGSHRLAEMRGSGGGETRYLVAQPIKIGKKVVAEAYTEAREDAEARL